MTVITPAVIDATHWLIVFAPALRAADTLGRMPIDRRSVRVSIFVSLLLFVLAVGQARAQFDSGAVLGAVRDSSGAVVCWLRGDGGWSGDTLAFGTLTGHEVIANPHGGGDIWLHDPRTGQPVGEPLTGCPETVTALAFCRPAGRDSLVATSPAPTLRIWHSGGEPAVTVDLPGPTVGLATAEHTGRCYVALPTAVYALGSTS